MSVGEPMTGAQVYDLLFPVVTREWAWRPRLISQLVAGLPATTAAPGPVIVDVGAGTGTQALAIAAAAPHARVIAVEPGINIHAAATKPNPHGVQWIQGDARSLPLADAAVDRVVISLALHHMTAEVRRAALAEFRRVLKSDGRLHVVEFGKPSDPLMRATSALARRLDDYEGMRDPFAGRIPAILVAAGFRVRPGRRRRTPGGVIEVTEAWVG